MILPLLSSLILLPLLGVFSLAFINPQAEQNIKAVSLWIAVITLILSLGLWARFDPTLLDYQWVEHYEWIKDLGISCLLGVDGLSLYFILLTTLLIPICILFSWTVIKTRLRDYMMMFLLLETFLLGSFCALDLVLFYLFFEGTLIPLFLIIGIWGGEERIKACFKFFLYTLAGSLFMLLAIIRLYCEFGTTNLIFLMGQSLPFALEAGLFLAFFISMAIKIPLWPFHTWLPYAHVEAPAAGSVILAGVLLKLGGYGLVRIVLPLFPHASQFFSPLAITLSLIGIFYASAIAYVQKDMKRLIAYSSIAHMGFVVLGLFSFTVQGITGAVLLMLSHGLVASALFLLVGMLYDRFHNRKISCYGGLYQIFPKLSVFFLCFTLASIAVPGTGSFVGEFYILSGIAPQQPIVAALALSGIILSPVYSLRLYRKLFTGKLLLPSGGLPHSTLESKYSTPPPRPSQVREEASYSVKSPTDLTALEGLLVSVLLGLIVFMGVYPTFFTSLIAPVVQAKVIKTKVVMTPLPLSP